MIIDFFSCFFQNIYSNHDLRRISYATCDPASNLLAFLAREPQAPLHLQHCHVFRTGTPDQAEDLNTLIGNAFRIAYASQIQDEHVFRENENVFPAFRTSRSADSLLSPDVLNGTPQEDLGIIADVMDEPVYEIPDFNRASRLRHSEQTFSRKTLNTTTNSRRVVHQAPLLSLPPNNEDFFTIQKAPPQPPPHPPGSNQSRTQACHQQHQNKSSSKFKPNSLPVLNCLFAALGRHKEAHSGIQDETPYVVPDLFTQMNNNVFRTSAKFGSSFTQDDLRLHDSGVSSQHSGESYYANQRNHQESSSRQTSSNMINKSKSAHVISCEVYSEVVDHTDPPCNMSTLKGRRPGHWNVDSLRQFDNTELIVSPGCNRYVITVWKFQDFSVIHILREINFGESGSAKNTIFGSSRGFNMIVINFT